MGKHAEVKRWEKYSDGGDEDIKMCPRCGDAILAQHENRETCGACGFSKIQK